jgi:tellurite resistance protein TerC
MVKNEGFWSRWRSRLSQLGYPAVRKVVVAVVGGTVILIGICLLVLPGPAFLVIPAGLAILATEFVWARRWINKAKAMLQKVKKP